MVPLQRGRAGAPQPRRGLAAGSAPGPAPASLGWLVLVLLLPVRLAKSFLHLQGDTYKLPPAKKLKKVGRRVACTSPGLPASMVGQQAVEQVLPLNARRAAKHRPKQPPCPLAACFTTSSGFTSLPMCVSNRSWNLPLTHPQPEELPEVQLAALVHRWHRQAPNAQGCERAEGEWSCKCSGGRDAAMAEIQWWQTCSSGRDAAVAEMQQRQRCSSFSCWAAFGRTSPAPCPHYPQSCSAGSAWSRAAGPMQLRKGWAINKKFSGGRYHPITCFPQLGGCILRHQQPPAQEPNTVQSHVLVEWQQWQCQAGDQGLAAPWQSLFCALQSPHIPLNSLGASALQECRALMIRSVLSYLFKRQCVLAVAEFLLNLRGMLNL